MFPHTPAYLFFLAIVTMLFWWLPKQNWRKAFLLFASYIFYGFFDLRFLGLLILLTVLVHHLGVAIRHSPHPRRYAYLSVAINLGTLGLFKYANFFLESVQSALSPLGIDIQSPGLHLLLPIGISFYTFQAISYTTEIYRKKSEPVNNILDFALYIAFFPKLIAGPLVRPKQFIEQITNPSIPPTSGEIQSALGLLLLGLVKKVLIADSLASLADASYRAATIPIGDSIFPTPLYIQGFYLYAFQIYADFSGYTDIALASAALLGFQLPGNFRQPYLASTITSFWNRWHMTLTQWFREYLFFPLSRSFLTFTKRRLSLMMQISANLITMVLIGLWHGAAWTYIVWGLWHGILLSIERLLGIKPIRRWASLLTGLATFHLVGIGWVLFRSKSLLVAGHFLKGLASFQQMKWLPYYLPSILVTGILSLGIDLVSSSYLGTFNGKTGRILKHVLVISAIVILTSLTILNIARGSDNRPFIYGQF